MSKQIKRGNSTTFINNWEGINWKDNSVFLEARLSKEQLELVSRWLKNGRNAACPFNNEWKQISCASLCGTLFEETKRTGLCPCNCLGTEFVIHKAKSWIAEAKKEGRI